MKIIKQGTPRSEDVFEGRCMDCKTVVQFKRSEAKYTPDQRDGDFLTVACPVCGRAIHVNTSLANQLGRHQ
jgi:ribosomal protein S27E